MKAVRTDFFSETQRSEPFDLDDSTEAYSRSWQAIAGTEGSLPEEAKATHVEG